jgi:hypothetical protein
MKTRIPVTTGSMDKQQGKWQIDHNEKYIHIDILITMLNDR